MTLCKSCYFADGKTTLNGLRSMQCIETELFGEGHCRWCGAGMERPYTGIDSRLCSHDCSANYYAFVLGDKTAALGSGKRYAAWLQTKENRKRELERGRQRRARHAKSV